MRFRSDGLNDLKYKLRFIREKRLYTWIGVDIEETSILQKHPVDEVPAGLLEDFRGDQPPHTIVIRGGINMPEMQVETLRLLKEQQMKDMIRKRLKPEQLYDTNDDEDLGDLPVNSKKLTGKFTDENERDIVGGYTMVDANEFKKAKKHSLILEQAMKRLMNKDKS